MIVAGNGQVARAELAMSKPQADGTAGPPEPFDAVVVTIGLGEAGELPIVFPLDIAQTIGEGMVKAATMKVLPATLQDMPRNGNGA